MKDRQAASRTIGVTSKAPAAVRRATNITLPEPLLAEARDLNINVSQACERGLSAEVADMKAKRWLTENRAAMEAWNDYVEEHGLPLAEFRPF